MLKREMVARIQEVANFYLGHGGLDFSGYIHRTKGDLELVIEAADELEKLHTEYLAIRAKYPKNYWLHVVTFPQNCTEEEINDKAEADELWRQANDIWLGRF